MRVAGSVSKNGEEGLQHIGKWEVSDLFSHSPAAPIEGFFKMGKWRVQNLLGLYLPSPPPFKNLNKAINNRGGSRTGKRVWRAIPQKVIFARKRIWRTPARLTLDPPPPPPKTLVHRVITTWKPLSSRAEASIDPR